MVADNAAAGRREKMSPFMVMWCTGSFGYVWYSVDTHHLIHGNDSRQRGNRFSVGPELQVPESKGPVSEIQRYADFIYLWGGYIGRLDLLYISGTLQCLYSIILHVHETDIIEKEERNLKIHQYKLRPEFQRSLVYDVVSTLRRASDARNA